MSTEESLVQQIQDCHALIQRYPWIVDTFVLDFFVDDIWEKSVPESWRSSFESATPEDLANLIDFDVEFLAYPWPPDIITLRSSIKQLSLSRKPISKADLNNLLKLSNPW